MPAWTTLEDTQVIGREKLAPVPDLDEWRYCSNCAQESHMSNLHLTSMQPEKSLMFNLHLTSIQPEKSLILPSQRHYTLTATQPEKISHTPFTETLHSDRNPARKIPHVQPASDRNPARKIPHVQPASDLNTATGIPYVQPTSDRNLTTGIPHVQPTSDRNPARKIPHTPFTEAPEC